MDLHGLDLTRPINRLKAGYVSIAVNVRAYGRGVINLRNTLTGALYTLGAAVHTIRRLNDATPNGPASGYAIVNGAGTTVSVWNSTINVVDVATGTTGNPMSFIPFRPNASPQPSMYIADAAAQGAVTLATKYLGASVNGPAGTAVNYPSNGMMKVNANGVVYKMGVAEPQQPPIVSTTNTSATFSGSLPATTIPWTNYNSVNSGYSYGETYGPPNPGSPNPVDGTAPFIVNCQNANFITIATLTGSATINGGTKTPTSSGPVSSTYPAYFIQTQGTGVTPPASATVVTGAFTDGAGNVVPMGVAPLYIPSVVDVGAVIGITNGITVPYGAVAFQIGIDSAGNTFKSNSHSGSFSISGSVTINALPTVTSILGTLTAYYWGDSPTSGATSSYIWKNPDDGGGSGPTRSISDAVGSTTGNSFIFDATFTAGIPALPGVGSPSVPMEWTTLNPQSVATGTNPVFATPITTTYPSNTSFQNFNFCVQGNIYFPSSGHYTFVLTNHDDVIWGIGGGVTLVSASTSGSGEGGVAVISDYGQTITVVGGYPLLPKEQYTSGSGGNYAKATVVVNVPAAGIYPIEIDFDYWYHSGRILILMASPTAGAGATIIPPLPSSVRQNTQYRGVYRSSASGATSNPSPASSVEAVPVTANTISLPYSTDPQIDVCDYYRIDSATSDYTYVNTGPNDGLGVTVGGVIYNTPVTDSLSDTGLGTQLLNYDNFEPVVFTDLPQKGVCSISAGVITWVSGGAIGGTSTGFNVRWLGGTEILIGSPTSLAYTAVRRPANGTTWDFTGSDPQLPNATNVAYEIPEPSLGATPFQHMMGPTDNINFVFAWIEGTLCWCEGNNLDAWPDTNQQQVTDPSEILLGGDIAGAFGVIGSIKRWWIIVPNFSNAVANVTGTQGSTWTLEKTSITRGLFMEWCVAVIGNTFFFRVTDGIHFSVEGAESKSITDDTIYSLFPHEGSVPAAITVQGVTYYPPDDTLPQKQRFKAINNYLYYDYQGNDGSFHTLVFDSSSMAWVWDLSTPSATCRAENQGVSQDGVLVGCSDSTVRQLSSGGTESITGTVMSGAMGLRGFCHCGAMVVEYSSTSEITLQLLPADSGNGSYGPQTITLAASATLTKFWFRPIPNKWKLLTYKFSSGAQFNINLEGCISYVKAWGSNGEYLPVPMFGSEGGEG